MRVAAPVFVRRYATEFGWDGTFEALVARIVADFAGDHDPSREAAWIAMHQGHRVGCVVCVAGPEDETALLRILLVHPDGRGARLGARLVDTCIGFARDAGYTHLRLWTNDRLVAEHQTPSFDIVGWVLELAGVDSSSRVLDVG